MAEPEKLEKLRQLDERCLRENILLPLLTRLGCKAPTIYHGPQERGKDIITYTNDSLGQREYVAVVAKRSSHCIGRLATTARRLYFAWNTRSQKLQTLHSSRSTQEVSCHLGRKTRGRLQLKTLHLRFRERSRNTCGSW